jgi:hypothetical protein
VCSSPLTLSNWRLGARTVDTSDQHLVHLPGCCRIELLKACNDEWDLCLGASSGSSGLAPLGVILLPTSFLQNSLHIVMDARGLAIDVSNFDGSRCRTCHRHPQGAHHRRLHFGGGRCQTCRQHPPRGPPSTSTLQWWPLPDLPPAPPKGPAIDIYTSVMPTVGPAASNPRGAAIDVSNFGGGRCWTCRQHLPGGLPSTSPTSVVAAAEPADSTPQGGRHRCLQLWWWPLPDLPPAPPRGPTIDVSNFVGGNCRTCRQHPLGGPPSTSLTSRTLRETKFGP